MDASCGNSSAPVCDHLMATVPCCSNELAVVDQDITAEVERIAHQAALIALLEAAGGSTTLADAQLGAMEQSLCALWVRREQILTVRGG